MELRIATYAAPLSREGPGLLLRDILTDDDPQILANIAVIDHVGPDVLLLTDFDFDAQMTTLSAFSDALLRPYPYIYAGSPNTGVQTGLDLDGDGVTGDARDALGFGRFLGDGGMAILSRYPIHIDKITDHSRVLWADLPSATLPQLNGSLFPSSEVFETLPVSSTAHWVVPIDVNGTEILVLAFDATPPVFDGLEDFNGLRNRDELRLWEATLEGVFGPVPDLPIVVGNANVDPFDGDGWTDGILRLLQHPALQDPHPASRGAKGAADETHLGPPELDTADWSSETPGNLRVSYILPSAGLTVAGAGVFWPAPDDPEFALLGGDGVAGAHHLVWVDLMVESAD